MTRKANSFNAVCKYWILHTHGDSRNWIFINKRWFTHSTTTPPLTRIKLVDFNSTSTITNYVSIILLCIAKLLTNCKEVGRKETKWFAIVSLDGVFGVEVRHLLVRIDSKQDIGHIRLQGEGELMIRRERGEGEREMEGRREGEREMEGETCIYLILSIADSEIVQESGFIQKHQPTCRISGFNFIVLSINTTCPHKYLQPCIQHLPLTTV